MTTYAELVAYFEAFTTTVPALKYVVVGDDKDVFDSQTTQVRYPALWVETPQVSFVNSDYGPLTRFDFKLLVFTNEPLGTQKAINQRLSEMLELAKQVYARISEDALDERLFDLVLKNNQAAPLTQWSADNCAGWLLEVSLEIFRDEIPD